MAQRSPKVPHVGVLTPAQTDATPIFDGLRNGLRDLGYIDGQSITLDFRCAKGNLDALPGLAAELVHIPVDLIVTDGNSAAKVAQEATRTIPIVMGVAAGALESGIVRSIARPGGNITGVSLGRVEQSGKRLELLKAAFPDVRVVAVLFNSMSVAGQISLPFVEDAAKKLGMTLIPLSTR